MRPSALTFRSLRLAAAFIPIFSAAAGAQSGETRPAPEAQPPVTVTETVTVTATRSGERPVTDLPVSVTVLSREEIEQTPAVTPDDLLRTVPSVDLPQLTSTTNLPINPSVAIRGFGLGDNATRTLVLLDGSPMNGAFFGNVFWNRVPQQELERIEVVRGASSSLFGSYAMSGVINLVTRPPASSRTLALNARGGSEGTFQGHAFASGPVGDRLRLSADLGGFTTDGYFLLPPEQRGAIDVRGSDDHQTAEVKAELAASAGSTLYLRANTYEEKQNPETRLGRNKSRVSEATLGLTSQASAESHWSAGLSYLRERFRIDNVGLLDEESRDAEFVSNAHTTPADAFGASLQWSRQLSSRGTVLTLGADYRSLSGEDDANIFQAPGVLAFRKVGEGDQRSLGVFAELGWNPLDKLEVQASLRGDRFETANGRDVTDGVETSFPDKRIEEVNPRLGLRYQVTPAAALRGVLYSGFRAPTLAELYRAFGTTTFQGLPNPLLDPERLTGGEVGVDLVTGRVFTQINGFYNRLKDLVGGVVVEFDPVFTLRNENIGEARSRGFELISTASLAGGSLSASYVYTDAEITANSDDPTLVGNHLEGAPRHAANLSAGFTAGPRLDVTVRGRYRSEQFQDSTNETRVPSYTVADAAASYRLTEIATLTLEVSNLFDREYTASAFGGLNRRGAPRQWLLGLRLRNHP